MGANIFGSCFQAITFGESHGPAMGVVVEGCPAGVVFSWEMVKEMMESRRPGRFPWMSDRKEPDTPELLSGVFEGRTLGTPVAFLVRNKDAKPADYNKIKNHPRPGHADDVWKKKFGHVDYRGGGRASGRETVGRVLAGALARMFLNQVYNKLKVSALPIKIGPFIREKENSLLSNKPLENQWFGKQTKKVEDFLIQKKEEGLSYGGTIEIVIENPPAGLGQPVFRKLKADFTSAFMGIGSCYEVSLGANSPLSKKDLSSEEGSVLHGEKNQEVYGGIRGGISTGEKITFQLKFKPPSSVLNTAKKGRHDPCILPRVAPVVEAMAYLVIADHVLWSLRDRV